MGKEQKGGGKKKKKKHITHIQTSQSTLSKGSEDGNRELEKTYDKAGGKKGKARREKGRQSIESKVGNLNGGRIAGRGKKEEIGRKWEKKT